MATTCKLIAKVNLSSNAASISFTDIPGTYTDLLIAATLRCNAAFNENDIVVRFNGATTDANMTTRWLQGNGSSAASGSLSYGYAGQAHGSTAISNTFAVTTIYIPNYAGNTNKSYSVDFAYEANATTAYVGCAAGLFSSTAAITGAAFTSGANNWVSGSSAYLYGITKA